jgi:hypothetical protein
VNACSTSASRVLTQRQDEFAACSYPAVRWRHLTLRERDALARADVPDALRRAIPSLVRVEAFSAGSDEGWELEPTDVSAVMQRPL